MLDRGGESVANTQMIRADHLQYITRKKLNKSDDKIIAAFEIYHPQVIDAESGIRGIIIEKPNITNYLYFSKMLQKEQLESRARKVVREIQEAKAIQESIDKKKILPKRFRINNLLVDVDYSIQTKLLELSEEDAINTMILRHNWAISGLRRGS